MVGQLTHVSVQLLPLPDEASDDVRSSVQDYLDNYFLDTMKVSIFWGTAKEFCTQLRERWDNSACRSPTSNQGPSRGRVEAVDEALSGIPPPVGHPI